VQETCSKTESVGDQPSSGDAATHSQRVFLPFQDVYPSLLYKKWSTGREIQTAAVLVPGACSLLAGFEHTSRDGTMFGVEFYPSSLSHESQKLLPKMAHTSSNCGALQKPCSLPF
jgi:hypothetical protein